jgi:TRAP transporter TAXI family solute receptor
MADEFGSARSPAGAFWLLRSVQAIALLSVLTLAGGLLMSARQPEEAREPRRALKFLMHRTYVTRVGPVLQRALQKAIPEMDIEIGERIREADIVTELHDGYGDVAFARADLSYLAYIGELDGRPLDRLRGIATLNTSPLYVLVRKDSSIRSFEDLRGRRVNLGYSGSGTAVTLELVLQALGDDVQKSYDSFQDSLVKLADGRIDATFAVAGYPLQTIRKAINDGGRLVWLSEARTRDVRRQHPFVRSVVIPPGVYGEEAISTVGVERLLIGRDGLDEDIVYRLTKVFFDTLPELSLADFQLRQMDVENAPATLVPLHRGAARYYREQEQL